MNSINSRKTHAIIDSNLYKIKLNVNLKMLLTKSLETNVFLLSYLKIALERKDWNEAGRVKSELDVMLRSDAMGFIVRSRYKQNAEEEKASLYHAAREAKNCSDNMSSLKIGGKLSRISLLLKMKSLISLGLYSMATTILILLILGKLLYQITLTCQIS